MAIINLQYANGSQEENFDAFGKVFTRDCSGENKKECDFVSEFKSMSTEDQYESLLAHSETRYFDFMFEVLYSDKDRLFSFMDEHGLEG